MYERQFRLSVVIVQENGSQGQNGRRYYETTMERKGSTHTVWWSTYTSTPVCRTRQQFVLLFSPQEFRLVLNMAVEANTLQFLAELQQDIIQPLNQIYTVFRRASASKMLPDQGMHLLTTLGLQETPLLPDNERV
jgi:hypothetical protein